MSDKNSYHVFLIRLWQESEGEQPGPLRIVLVEPGSGETTSFLSLRGLLRHLEEWAGQKQLLQIGEAAEDEPGQSAPKIY